MGVEKAQDSDLETTALNNRLGLPNASRSRSIRKWNLEHPEERTEIIKKSQETKQRLREEKLSHLIKNK
ncbi:MAG: hypothetical protein WCV81_00190 [Microgenomates group bacterium]|jgi:hypothetical protein